MIKILNFFLIIISSILIAGIYGILHDQITYTISPEYYTLFKFEQFGINQWGVSNERIKAGIVGFLATWWVGYYLGIIYAFVSLFFKSKEILKITIKSIFFNLLTALVFGFLGFLWSFFFLDDKIDWYIPANTRHVQDFINVGSIHNFGYIGGVVGLFIGIYCLVKNAKSVSISKN
ncbi:hypothetical protein [Flavobacterium daemonense]|uniref:hypothetical protein n=1 Tax=Flavobacterium daemonense TaxID=1393049 RepID=UPI0011869434|nr:hypothetical protein [Flavobacterium daemonense]KAF2334274.1 hypothetical protein FND99_08200 [Flavobacterium daemonense]